MYHSHLNAIFPVQVFCKMLRAIYASVLSSRASEAEHERSEPSLHVSLYMSVGELIYAVEEGEYLAVVLKESYHGFVESRELFVRLISSGVVCASAIENISTTVFCLVLRYSLSVGKAIDANHEWPLAVVFGECGRSVLRMSLIHVILSYLISVGAVGGRLFDACKLRHLDELTEHVYEIRIWEVVLSDEFPEVLYCWWNRVDEVFFLLVISSESISSEHL